MNYVWVLMFAFWTPENGTVHYPITQNEAGQPYSSYAECYEDAIALANEAVAQGVEPNNIDGNCFFVLVDEDGYPVTTDLDEAANIE